MEGKVLNEIEIGRNRVGDSNLICKSEDSGEYFKQVHCNLNLPSNFDPNKRRKKLKENSSSGKKLARRGADLAEAMYDSFHIKIPANLVSIDYVIKSLKSHRKTKSINAIDDLSIIGSPLSVSGDISRCTSERWMFDSVDKPMTTRKVPRYPLNFGTVSKDSGPESSGVIRMKWNDGLPYFEFHLRGKGGEFLIANPLKVNSSNNRGLDVVYLFHTRASKKTDLNIVGLMEVSSSLILNSASCCNYVDTEFVLFSTETRECDLCCTKGAGFISKTLEILRPNNPFGKSKSTRRVNVGESSVVDESSFIGSLSQKLPSDFESCATVVRSYQYKGEKGSVSGGWGLNFLPKAENGERNGDNCEEKGRKFGVELSILLPNGVHGSPDAENTGPSSLVERWRSGGSCDCGGWDLGCPITVLKNDNFISSQEELPRVDANGSINISVEGSKKGDPTISLSGGKEGISVVYNNTVVSALQCFSVGVAILHQQIPHKF